jgi:hypothetical protein
MHIIMRRSAIVAALGLLLCSTLVRAGTPPAAQKSPTNDDCLACHGDSGAKRADGRPVAVAPDTFAASIHGQSGITCVSCHVDLAAVTEFPHADKLAPAQCTACHDKAAAAYETGVHAQARRRAGNMSAATCADCHGTHDIRPSSDPESRTHHMNLLETCGRCHGNEEIIKRGKIAIGNVVTLFEDSIHGRALIKSGLSVAPTCTDCHGNHDIRRRTDAASHIFRRNIPATCGKCHQGVERQYLSGIHGALLEKGSPLAPVCADCHTAHQIRRADVDAWKLEVVRECGTCHEESLKTYGDTFHGQVTALGYTRVATCADCHSSHLIFPKADPRSTVSSGKVVETCRKCHSSAAASFAQYDPHADHKNRARNPWLYFAARFMQMLLFGVFAFFGLHTALWFGRSLQLKAAGRHGGKGGDGTTEDGHGK